MANSLFAPELDFVTTSRRQRTVGVRFPLSRTEGGDWSKQFDRDLIYAGFKQLLLTQKGERVMFPNFGTNLRRYLFEPVTQSLKDSIDAEIREAARLYEPRVVIRDVSITNAPGGNEEFNGIYILINLSFVDDAASQEQIEVVLTT